ncbi:hypothetical protein C2G38_1547722 [Gigaspora rosea]|uniref:Secreted protein n=1 Tax=Gigaspora rosea TaxID=44941 RepID=A0A397V2Y8_9GLOM|nr:hypothetical protein C2G38_1547722 [Gigaspora rosea]
MSIFELFSFLPCLVRHIGASLVVVLKCRGSVALLAYIADEYVCLSLLCLCSSENFACFVAPSLGLCDALLVSFRFF